MQRNLINWNSPSPEGIYLLPILTIKVIIDTPIEALYLEVMLLVCIWINLTYIRFYDNKQFTKTTKHRQWACREMNIFRLYQDQINRIRVCSFLEYRGKVIILHNSLLILVF